MADNFDFLLSLRIDANQARDELQKVIAEFAATAAHTSVDFALKLDQKTVKGMQEQVGKAINGSADVLDRKSGSTAAKEFGVGLTAGLQKAIGEVSKSLSKAMKEAVASSLVDIVEQAKRARKQILDDAPIVPRKGSEPALRPKRIVTSDQAVERKQKAREQLNAILQTVPEKERTGKIARRIKTLQQAADRPLPQQPIPQPVVQTIPAAPVPVRPTRVTRTDDQLVREDAEKQDREFNRNPETFLNKNRRSNREFANETIDRFQEQQRADPTFLTKTREEFLRGVQKKASTNRIGPNLFGGDGGGVGGGIGRASGDGEDKPKPVRVTFEGPASKNTGVPYFARPTTRENARQDVPFGPRGNFQANERNTAAYQANLYAAHNDALAQDLEYNKDKDAFNKKMTRQRQEAEGKYWSRVKAAQTEAIAIDLEANRQKRSESVV